MDNKNFHFTREQLEGELKKYIAKAQEYLRNNRKLKELLHTFQTWLQKGRSIPALSGIVDDLCLMLDMLMDYADGEYTNISGTSLAAAGGLILYLLNPLDLIPDTIPVLGFLDDAAAAAFVMRRFIRPELEKYRFWKDRNVVTSADAVDVTEE